MPPALSQELSPSPDSSLPSPSRFRGGPRLLPLEADAGDGELPVLAALRGLAPVGDPPHPGWAKGTADPMPLHWDRDTGSIAPAWGGRGGTTFVFLTFYSPLPFAFGNAKPLDPACPSLS